MDGPSGTVRPPSQVPGVPASPDLHVAGVAAPSEPAPRRRAWTVGGATERTGGKRGPKQSTEDELGPVERTGTLGTDRLMNLCQPPSRMKSFEGPSESLKIVVENQESTLARSGDGFWVIDI